MSNITTIENKISLSCIDEHGNLIKTIPLYKNEYRIYNSNYLTLDDVFIIYQYKVKEKVLEIFLNNLSKYEKERLQINSISVDDEMALCEKFDLGNDKINTYINDIYIRYAELPPRNGQPIVSGNMLLERFASDDLFKEPLDEFFKILASEQNSRTFQETYVRVPDTHTKENAKDVQEVSDADKLDKMVSSFLEDHKEDIEGKKEPITIHHVFVIFLIAVLAALSVLLFIN